MHVLETMQERIVCDSNKTRRFDFPRRSAKQMKTSVSQSATSRLGNAGGSGVPFRLETFLAAVECLLVVL
jgi:hypothetical protein